MDQAQQVSRTSEGTLEGWKEIADHLQRTVQTARRWERTEGLPVHRHQHQARASVYAYRSELDAWIGTRQPASEPVAEARPWSWRPSLALAAALLFPLVAPSSSPLRPASAGQADHMTERRVWSGAEVMEGALSPDGRLATVIDYSTGNLMLRDLETGEVRPLTDKDSWADGPALAQWSIFSRDGSRVAYTWVGADARESGRGVELRVVDVDGANTRTLHAAGNIDPKDWSDDGRWIAAIVRTADHAELALIDAASGGKRVLVTLPEGVRPGTVQFSPDGRFVAYDRSPSESPGPPDIYMAATDGNSDVRVVDHPAIDRVMDWSPDGRFVLFMSNRSRHMEAWAVAVDGASPSRNPFRLNLDLPTTLLRVDGFAPNGGFSYRTSTDRWETYVTGLDLTAERVPAPPTPVSAAMAGMNHSPAWSPKGDVLAYLREPDSRRRTLVLQTVATGSEREIEIGTTDAPVRPTRGSLQFAPDGSRLLLAARGAAGGRGLYVVHLATGETEPVLLPADDDASELQDPRFSSDGRYIYYRRVGPNYELVRWDRTADERAVLYSSPAGEVSTGFAVSPDGRWVAFSRSLTADGRPAQVFVMPSAGGEPRLVFSGEPAQSADLQAFTADSSHLLITRAPFGTAANELWRVALESGEAARVEIGLQPTLVRVHPDGRQLAVEARELYGEQWVIENLPAALAAAAR